MNCEQAQDLLAQSDLLTDQALSPVLQDHIARCPRCADTLARLQRLEQAVRDMPDPHWMPLAHRRFEDAMSRGGLRRVSSSGWLRFVSGVAAVLLVGILIGGALMIKRQRQQEGADLVGQLVAWNVGLSQLQSTQERARLYKSGAEAFRLKLARARLTPEEQQIAQRLLADALWFTRQNDALADADRFHDAARLMVDQMDVAAKGGDLKALASLGQNYYTMMEKGVNPYLNRIRSGDRLPPELDPRVKRILAERAMLRFRLRQIMMNLPPHAREQLRRALMASGEGREPDDGRLY